MAQAGGWRPRPPFTSVADRPLRFGYVSADLCQHTVGLFVKDVLKAHDPERVTVFAYSAGKVRDWVTDGIRAACTFRDVSAFDDVALADLIRQDGIDVLVDLSGHTAGSRLTVFAHRPAPVQVSWLGYFATTAKLNDGVFDVWARILTAVPDSRLILKWRSFNDDALRQSVTAAFAQRGVASERSELRGPSFHVDLLKEYADIDIALDPFPFTGGLTSCEALWMGVPVVTWPQSRVVSRQTFAFLSAIGLAGTGGQ